MMNIPYRRKAVAVVALCFSLAATLLPGLSTPADKQQRFVHLAVADRGRTYRPWQAWHRCDN